MSITTDTQPEILTEPANVAAPEPLDTTTEPAPEESRGLRWGLRNDGQARRKPGRKPGQRNGTGTTRKTTPRAAAAPKPSTPKTSTSGGTRKRTDYSAPIAGMLGLILAPLSMFLPLDAMAIGMRSEEIVKVTNDLGNDVPQFGAILDKLLAATPYAAAGSVAVSLLAQIAHNHGLVPEQTAVLMGGVPRTHLLAAHQAQKEAARQAAAEEQARYQQAMDEMAAQAA